MEAQAGWIPGWRYRLDMAGSGAWRSARKTQARYMLAPLPKASLRLRLHRNLKSIFRSYFYECSGFHTSRGRFVAVGEPRFIMRQWIGFFRIAAGARPRRSKNFPNTLGDGSTSVDVKRLRAN